MHVLQAKLSGVVQCNFESSNLMYGVREQVDVSPWIGLWRVQAMLAEHMGTPLPSSPNRL